MPQVLVRSPICIWIPHCGSYAALEATEEYDDCIQTELVCVVCKRTGVISERKDLKK
jgi:hypothetical protein